MAWQVFDGNKPADCWNHNVDSSWNKSKYETLEEAITYANNWLYYFTLDIPSQCSDYMRGYDYSGSGDILQIREVD